MLIRSLTKIIAVGVLALSTCTLFAQDEPSYPPDYPFGDNGNEGHPNGYDGWPGDHPDNPIAPHCGPGGKGIGSGNGGQGGAGAPPGGHGGAGGGSGDDGGCGGGGGNGGGNPNGTGGDGGNGGGGVDCGGPGGNGGGGTSGGSGGNGGNATGLNGEAGDGGDGGSASEGIGGTGGNGGHGPGPGGCGGDAGNGGNGEDNGVNPPSMPGLPGRPGLGNGIDIDGEPCDGDNGTMGKRKRVVIGGIKPEIMPIALTFDVGFPAIQSVPIEDVEQVAGIVRFWKNQPGPEFEVGARQYPPYSFDLSGTETYQCLLHPDSLNADVLRIELEARSESLTSFLSILFGSQGDIEMTPSIPMPLEDDWKRFYFTIVRPVAGVALGKHLDMFTYSGRDYDVRSFKVVDLGKKGDVNLDQVVDIFDLLIVSENYAQEGDIGIESGDTNLDGVVNIEDVLNVINGIQD